MVEIENYYRRGKSLQDWYEEAGKLIKREAPHLPTKVACGIFAACSQNTSLDGNWQLFYKILEELPEVESGLTIVKRNVRKCLLGQWPNGPKISAFAKALAGEASAVPVDRWMARMYGWQAPTERRRKEIEADIRKRASRAGVEPRQFQSAVWFGYRHFMLGRFH